jgi:hypothetical protein
MNLTKNYDLGIISHILSAVFLLILALTVLVQANPGTYLPGRDYGAYAYIGDQILHGKFPYRDAWESKPPAIFYLNAIAIYLGRGSHWGIWIVEFISLLAAGIFSYAVAKKLWGIWPAIGALVFWTMGLDLTLDGGNLTEEYPLPLHFLSIALFLQLIEEPKKPAFNFMLGLTFSLSFLFRPNNAVVETTIIFILFLLGIVKRNWKELFPQAFWIGIGILLPILLATLYFWTKGLLWDLIEASLLYNFSYSATTITSVSPLVSGFRLFGWLAWVALGGYLIAVYYALKSKQPLYLLLLIGTPMSIYVSDLARRDYAHYFMNLLPFLVLLGGLTLLSLTVRLTSFIKHSPAWERIALGAATFLALAFFLVSGRAAEYQKALERIAEGNTIEIRTRTAAYVENHTQPNELVLFWAASPGENFMSNRESPSAYLFYPLHPPSEITQRMNDQFLQDIRTKRPVLIVDIGDHQALSLNAEERAQQLADGFAWEYPPDNLDEFFKFVEENYYLDALVGKKAVYRLRE